MSMDYPVKSPKKLIEVALPLDAINVAAKEEKAVPRRGHPQTLHYWWARRPLAAARAVIFGQLVNDPSWKWELEHSGEIPPGHLKASWAAKRKQLFDIIVDLVQWENTNNEKVVERAREEIRRSWRETCTLNSDHPQASTLFNADSLPELHDPFAGGGTIPLEAQRLGLVAHATDLNPVAVLINKAMIEIPPTFAGWAAVNPTSAQAASLIAPVWNGTQGLASDVRYYGQYARDEAYKRIGNLYPKVTITQAMATSRPDLIPHVGRTLNILAWMWARTVKSPNPAFSHVEVPLSSTFVLSIGAANQSYVKPVLNSDKYYFEVCTGKAPPELEVGTSAGKRKAFKCLVSDSPIDYVYIRSEGKAGRIGQKLMAVVAESEKGRIYLSPTPEMEAVATKARASWKPDCEMPKKHRNFQPPVYGMDNIGDLFTDRQLVALSTLSDLIEEIRQLATKHAIVAGMPDTKQSLANGGDGATAYGDAVAVYLACALSRTVTYNNTLCFWNIKGGSVAFIFARQAIPMSWDFIEINLLEKMSGNWLGAVEWVSDVLEKLPSTISGVASQHNAMSSAETEKRAVISTDPPYYDNISYAELSDFLYAWLRRSLKPIFPALFATLAVPKAEELVAAPDRHGGKAKSELFFMNGMTRALQCLKKEGHPAFPVTIYYAFKQSETTDAGTVSTGWEAFLEAVITSGFAINGTWPMRTERNSGVKTGTNSLASSIVLVCRQRQGDAVSISRRDFIRELNKVLPEALDEMTRGVEGGLSPVAPVDLSQAIIGPGMAVFSKYAAVLEADGSPMTVRAALQLINRFLAEDDFDADTQFCLHWFEQYGWENGTFGEADTLARAKGTSVDGVKHAGVLHAAGGNVRLLKWADYASDWDPRSDERLPVWEIVHQLISVFNTEGEAGAASVYAAVQSKAEPARQLAYRLYTLCERKSWSDDARAYNDVVTSWSGIEAAAAREPIATQTKLF